MLNFGLIKETLNDILVEGILTKNADKKITYQKFASNVKKNPILREQFMVYRNIETKIGDDNTKIDSYVNENLSVLKKFGLDKIKIANKKLLSELGVSVDNKLDYKTKQLHEEICNLLEFKKTARNVNKIVESVEVISNFIKNNQPKKEVNEAVVPTSILAKISVEKFNTRYSDMSETEKAVIKVMVEGKDEEKSKLLKNSINECVTLIDENFEASELEIKNKLLKAKNKLLNISFCNESFITDISTVVKLTENLKKSNEDKK